MKKKNILMISCLCILTGLLVIGVSYAYWRASYFQDKTNALTSGCFSLELSNEQNEISLVNAYPITDEEGKKLKPFSFTLTNTCSTYVSFAIQMEMLEGTTLNSNYVAVMVNNEAIQKLGTLDTASTTIDGSTESRVIARGFVGADDSVDYSVRFWIDEDVTLDDDINYKTFKSKIVITSEPGSYSPVEAGYTKLKDAILANEYQTTPERSIEKINAKQAVDLTNTAPVIKWLETTGTTTTMNIAKPAASAIKSDAQTSNLTTNDTLLRLYKTKTLHSDTGKYDLSNPVYVDPTTLDFNETTNGGIKYYFRDENISYDNSTGKLYTWNNTEDSTIYQVTDATKKNSTTTWNGVSYASITYTLNITEWATMQLEIDKSDKGLYAGADRDGTTYYYRGNVKNNNVYFAGFYWQIVRINGDGSIRLMYNGKSPNATGVNQSINEQNYQFNSNYNNPAYVGYMYGNTIGTRENNIKNEVNSTIKTAVDNWYKSNILDVGYSNYIEDAGFCNDRSLYVGSGGDGAQTDIDTRYGAFDRYQRKTATFTCPNEESDLFTLKDSTYGNKDLTYPVGLITYDELAFAGMDYYHINKLSWVYSSQSYWTMTPFDFHATSGHGINWRQDHSGYLNPWNHVDNYFGTRPVISLNANVEITEGLGTPDKPFVVKTN